MNAPDESRYLVPGLTRGLRILQSFSREQPRLSAAEIGRALELPRASAFRLIQTLETLGFLERDANVYRLGPAVLGLGFEYLASLGLTDLGRPVIDTLRDKSGHSAHLAIRDGADAVILLKAAGPSAFSSWVNVGTRLPAHATVLGRALLLDMPAAGLKSLFGGRLKRFSDHTPGNLKELEALLAGDRAKGAALSEGFYENNICSIACPVRDRGGRISAAISITIPRATFAPEQSETLIAGVRAAAEQLGERLSHEVEAKL
jgi:DNA-binding IclR family transcriptional regulator